MPKTYAQGAPPSGGSPGSPDTSVQRNNAGSFAGDARFTYTTTRPLLTLTSTWSQQGTSPLFIERTCTPVAATAGNNQFALKASILLNPGDDLPQSLTAFIQPIYGEVLASGANDISVVVPLAGLYYNQNTGTTFACYGCTLDIVNLGGGTITTAYGVVSSIDNILGNITTAYGFYGEASRAAGTFDFYSTFYGKDLGAAVGTIVNPYYFWADSQGVYRIREDNVADTSSFPQAITALYNPRFTKYTPGAANFERIVQQWKSNKGYLGNEAGGTGVLRPIVLMGSEASVEDGSGNLVQLYTGGLVGSGNDVSITGATTGTINKVNIVTGTSADYTVTVPTAVGNRGKWIEFVFGPTLTELSKFVTLDGTSSEKIGGVLSRLFWAGESVRLTSDGTNWQVSSYKFMAMACTMSKSTQDIATVSEAKINIDTTNFDNTGLMASTGGNEIICRRTGTYQVMAWGQWGPTLIGNFFRTYPKVNGTTTLQGVGNMITAGAGGYFLSNNVTQPNISITAGQDIECWAGNFALGTETVTSPTVAVVEQAGW